MKKLIILLITIPITWALAAADTWLPEVQVTHNRPFYSGEPAITATESAVYVVWEDYRDGNYEIYFKSSPNGKDDNWTADRRLTATAAKSWRPDIAACGNNLYVVWEENSGGTGSVWFLMSNDGGLTWGNSRGQLNIPEKVNTTLFYAAFPSVFANDTSVYVTWEDSRAGNDEIFLRRFSVINNWQTEQRVTNALGDSWGSDVAVDAGGTIHVVWFDYRDGNDEIYYKHSANSGLTWSTDLRLTSNSEISWDPRIAIDQNNNLHVTWYDWRDNKDEVYYKRSATGGTLWSADTRLSTLDNADSRYPDLTCQGARVYVAWEDYRDGNDEIYCAVSANNGMAWDAPVRLTTDPASSWCATIAANSLNVFITWQDYRTNDDEIWAGVSEPTIGISSAVIVGALTAPAAMCAPNPFRQATIITYDPSRGRAIGIYTTDGRLVQLLTDRKGSGRLVWDGLDRNGRPAAPGLYICKVPGAAERTLILLP
jgi:hypothetical protein